MAPLGAAHGVLATTNTWTPVPSMSAYRSALGAATGSDGRIYAVGGLDRNNGALSAVEAYTPGGTWSAAVAPLPTARFGLAVAAGPDGRIYAMGGDDGTGLLDVVNVYTPSTNTWVRLQPLPVPTRDATAVGGADGRIYIVGGLTQATPGAPPTATDAVLAYTPDPGGGPGSWTPASGPGALAPMSVPRSSLGATTGPDGLIYALGGYASGSAGRLATAEAYDPKMNIWTAVPPMSEARAGLAAALDPAGTVDAIGGGDSTAEAYSPATGKWSDLPAMSTSRTELAAATGPLGDGRVYAIGGYDTSQLSLAIVEAYPFAASSLFTGDASAVYFKGVRVSAGGSTQTLPDGGQHLCEATVSSTTAVGTTNGQGAPGCQGIETGQGPGVSDPIVYNPTGSPTPTAVLSVEQETVTTQGDLTNGSSVASSKLDAISLLPGALPGTAPGTGVDVLDATTITASSSSTCESGPSGRGVATSQIGRLTIDGVTVATQPIGSQIVLNPLGGRLGSPGYVRIYGNPIAVNPTGSRIPMAMVTLNYSRYDPFSNTVTSSPADVRFPVGGPLSSVIVGDVLLSFAQSGMVGCHV